MPRLFAANNASPTGARLGFTGLISPEGWVLASGRTMGNASSGGTERANADTFPLFELLWNSYSNTELPVSGGRGGSAAADYAANKTITLPDYRGRVGAGKDNMGGSSANRVTSGSSSITGTTLGAAGGSQTIAQHGHGPGSLSTGSNLSNHVHLHGEAFTGENNASHARLQLTANVAATSVNQSNHGHSVTGGETAQTGTNISGSGHGNMVPTIIETAIIKL